jgi:hypothetical protein
LNWGESRCQPLLVRVDLDVIVYLSCFMREPHVVGASFRRGDDALIRIPLFSSPTAIIFGIFRWSNNASPDKGTHPTFLLIKITTPFYTLDFFDRYAL